VAASLGVLGVVLGLPLLALVERSFALGDHHGLAGWRALVDPPERSVLPVAPWEAVRTSLVVALVATAVALAVALPAAVVVVHGPGRLSRVLDAGLVLPLGTSAVTLGLGMLIALDEPPLDLRTSRALLPLAHALVGIPLVLRAVVPVLRSVEPRLREAAASLGAPPWRVWREVDLPVAARGIAVGAGFAFAVSLGEFGATSFLVRPSTTTMPVAVFRLLGRPGALNTSQAMAMATVLMLVTAVAVLVIERFRPATASEL
jgi:thiamine transport system permease protein